jgi:hypothetical protein
MSQATSTPVTTENGRGTPGYRAPELFATDNPNYNNRCDIWALGCILHELSTGQRLFTNDYAVALYANAPLDSPHEVSFEPKFWQHHISEFLHELLNKDAALRPNTEDTFRLMLGYFYLSDFRDSALFPAGEVYLSYRQHKLIAQSPRRHHEDRLRFLFRVFDSPFRSGSDWVYPFFFDGRIYLEEMYSSHRPSPYEIEFGVRLVDEMIIATWYTEAALVYGYCTSLRPPTRVQERYVWLWTTHWPMLSSGASDDFDTTHWAVFLSPVGPSTIGHYLKDWTFQRRCQILDDCLLMTRIGADVDTMLHSWEWQKFDALYIGKTTMATERIRFEGKS